MLKRILALAVIGVGLGYMSSDKFFSFGECIIVILTFLSLLYSLEVPGFIWGSLKQRTIQTRKFRVAIVSISILLVLLIGVCLSIIAGMYRISDTPIRGWVLTIWLVIWCILEALLIHIQWTKQTFIEWGEGFNPSHKIRLLLTTLAVGLLLTLILLLTGVGFVYGIQSVIVRGGLA